MVSFFNRVWWSAAGDPENFSAPDAGSFDVINGAGGITGLASLGELFFIFQEKCHTIYQYQPGDNPLAFIKTVWHGCNSHRTIVEIEGSLFYLSDVGEIRVTNGSSDVSLSDKIKPLANKIINGRTVKNYYDDAPNTMPCAFYDKYYNAYRLFYAGTSTYNDKCLSYFLDKGVFTTASGTFVMDIMPTFGYDAYIGMYGNSNASGITNYLVPNYADTSKVGTIDLGWISSGDVKKQIQVKNIEIWFHAEAGSIEADNCDTIITVTAYIDPETNTALGTYTDTLAYNATADNLQKKRIRIDATGDYVRLVITDSGTMANYSIDRIIVDADQINSPR